MVYDCEDGVESCTNWQRHDEVHRNGLERESESSCRYSVGKGLIQTHKSLVLLARSAAFDIVRDP